MRGSLIASCQLADYGHSVVLALFTECLTPFNIELPLVSHRTLSEHRGGRRGGEPSGGPAALGAPLLVCLCVLLCGGEN